jgi:hypothetical protein
MLTLSHPSSEPSSKHQRKFVTQQDKHWFPSVSLRSHISSTPYNDEEIRRAAAEVLGQIKSPRAVKPIIETLRNVRSALAIYDSLKGALVSINEPAIPVLVEALEDESPIVRQVAMESLAELQGIHISKWLKEVLAVKPLTEVLFKALKEPEKNGGNLSSGNNRPFVHWRTCGCVSP